jgi:formamidopyrimidine-DNA glycosylase
VELPEVEVMRRDLEKDVVGRKVTEAEVRPSRNAMRVIRRHAKRKEFADRLVGRKFTRPSAGASTCCSTWTTATSSSCISG